MSAFLMPSLGADMEDGTLVEQLIAPGAPVKRGDIIAVVETQKGAIEIEVFENGFLDSWLVPVGTKVPVGTPLARIRGSDTPDPQPEPDIPQPKEPAPTPRPPEAPQPHDPEPVPSIPEDPQPAPSPAPDWPDEVRSAGRQRVTPAARRQAARAGIDLSAFGSDRIISLKDLPRTTDPPAAAPLSAMRQAIAAAMTRSKHEIPHYYLSDTIDLTAAESFLSVKNADLPPDRRVVMGALFIRAVAHAARAFPEFNGFFEDGAFRQSTAVHVGMAINLRQGGLVAPALHDAADGDLDTVMDRLRDLVARVRQGRFRARELSDPTITLTSLGDRGVRQITGVIFPPQVAIVGIGMPGWEALAVDGEVMARRCVDITLAADHRVSDGQRGARFLRAIIAHLQTPEAL